MTALIDILAQEEEFSGVLNPRWRSIGKGKLLRVGEIFLLSYSVASGQSWNYICTSNIILMEQVVII